MKTIFSEVLEVKDNYERGTIERIEGLVFSQYYTIKMIEFYSNSRYLDGQKDELGREKPFFNIVNANVDVSIAATDVDLKDIILEAADSASQEKSFILNKLAQGWMRETNFSATLNDIGETLPRYGGVLVKKCEYDGELEVQVVPWKNIITDQVDIKNGIKIEKHWMSPVELSKKSKVWRNVDQAIALCEKGEQQDAPRGTVLVYEVEGFLPKSFKTGKIEDKNNYKLQCWYVIANGKAQIDLYDEELTESRYKYHPWKKVAGRGLGWGVVEDGEQAQVWTNDSIIQEQSTMELAGKVIVQSASKKYAGRNVLTEIDQGQILEHEDNKPFTRIDLTPSSLPVWQTLVQRWGQQFDRSSSITDALRGETPPSGQAYRLQALVTQASASQFDYRREAKGIFISEIFYDWVIPHLIKKLNKGGEYGAEFSKEELDRIDEMFVNSMVMDELAKIKESNGMVDPMQIDEITSNALNKMGKGGANRYLQVPKGFFDKIRTKIRVDLTGEQKNKMAQLESLANIFNQIQMTYNPNTGKFAALEDPVLSEIFYSIVEGSGIEISPVTLAARAREQKAPMAMAPAAAPAGGAPASPDSGYKPTLPQPDELLPAATT